MEKTDNFFLIHNFNTIPDNLIAYTSSYCIVDASDDPAVTAALKNGGYTFTHRENTGHNLTSYFSWFAENYDALPEVVCLLKGNIIGRHCSAEYFDKVYGNTWFTYLYEDKKMIQRYSKPTEEMLRNNHWKDPNADSIASLLAESRYVELNSSWYMHQPTHLYRYFRDYDDALRFIYKDPVIPKMIEFAPGGCYILRREQIRLHRPEFYLNLNKIMNYTMTPGFPAEAYIVERMLPAFFEIRMEENPWMNDPDAFDAKLEEQRKRTADADAADAVHFKRLRRMLGLA